MSKVTHPKTLVEAVRYFADPAVAQAFLAAMRWPDGVTCPTCGSKEVTYLENDRRWKCRTEHKRQKFSAKVGTVMEDSPIGLDKWLPTMWLIASCKNGISSYEVARGLKVTQKTAWFMLHRIRLAMQESGGMLGGGFGGEPVEVDETYIGGRARMMNAKRRKAIVKGSGPHQSGKTMVMGILERHGRIRAKVIADLKRTTLAGEVSKTVKRGSNVYTDENAAYDGLVPPHFFRQAVNHAETYVRGNVHTNGIENFWSLLKRGLRGTYVAVEPFHLFRYVDEQAFRFNTRKAGDGERFMDVVRMAVGKRLTYRHLTGGDSLLATA
jgi:transposase-like protein